MINVIPSTLRNIGPFFAGVLNSFQQKRFNSAVFIERNNYREKRERYVDFVNFVLENRNFIIL